MAPAHPTYPLYNTSFTLYRLSPLHFPASKPLLSRLCLDTHERRLGEQLKGEVLRGVYVGLDDRDDGITRAGSFKACRWSVLGKDTTNIPQGQSDSADGLGVTEGVKVELEFERNTHSALLLREASNASISTSTSSISSNATAYPTRDEGEMHYPLMLTRMPAALREMFIEYLATTFDTRVEPMRLSTSFIASALDNYFAEVADLNNGAPKLEDIAFGDIRLSIGFASPISPSLKSLDMVVEQGDVANFIQWGKSLPSTGIHSQKTNGRSMQKAEMAKVAGMAAGPFLLALTAHINAQLALDMNHESLFISTLACGAFAMSLDGKMKLFTPGFDVEVLDESVDLGNPPTPLQRGIAKIIKHVLAGAMGG